MLFRHCICVFCVFLWVCACNSMTFAANHPPLNILLITADDMNYDAPGVMGCKIKDITPNIDALARAGIQFRQGYVTASVCQPSRQVLMTGRYPHRNGGTGFNPINLDVPTLQESLHNAGYYQGIMAKTSHLAPASKFHWDMLVKAEELQNGRNPDDYYQKCTEFFANAKKAGKPFFLMANSQDPHRPFAGSVEEKKWNSIPSVRRTIQPDEVEVPEFLPDIPDVRKEVAQYYTCVHRCDETVGKILQALKEAGAEDNTLVMFISDNGMSFPFAKTNVYPMSNHTPWFVRWPGTVKPGGIDTEHFVSGIDYMPTILDALGIAPPEGMDGKSFLPLLKGEKQPERDHVYTTFYQTSGKQDFPMRSYRTKDFDYMFSPWSNGTLIFRNESQSGLTFRAMQAAAVSNPQISTRVELFQKRVLHEFYTLTNDPHALVNRIDDTALKSDIATAQAAMLRQMKACDDPLTNAFDTFLKTGKPDMTGVHIGPQAQPQGQSRRQAQLLEIEE